MRTTTAPAAPLASTRSAALPIVVALCFTHFLNDMTQALLPAIYPIIKQAYQLDFGQIGLLTLAFQFTASLLQPVVGMVTDRHPQPYSLATGMASSLVGLLMLATATHYWVLFVGAMLIGTGSAVFHPEATRMARFASGGRHGCPPHRSCRPGGARRVVRPRAVARPGDGAGRQQRGPGRGAHPTGRAHHDVAPGGHGVRGRLGDGGGRLPLGDPGRRHRIARGVCFV